jgi:hypothetical protein
LSLRYSPLLSNNYVAVSLTRSWNNAVWDRLQPWLDHTMAARQRD